MRIVEQTGRTLILRSSVKYFWFGMIFFLSSDALSILLLLAVPFSSDEWLRLLLLFLLLLAFCVGLQQAWSSEDVKSCNFNKVLNQITIDFHGLKPRTEFFSLEDMPALEVRETMFAVYGSVSIGYQLWLITRSEDVFLSGTHSTKTEVETIADRVREFLLPIERSI
jgi:hypothetical protein